MRHSNKIGSFFATNTKLHKAATEGAVYFEIKGVASELENDFTFDNHISTDI